MADLLLDGLFGDGGIMEAVAEAMQGIDVPRIVRDIAGEDMAEVSGEVPENEEAPPNIQEAHVPEAPQVPDAQPLRRGKRNVAGGAGGGARRPSPRVGANRGPRPGPYAPRPAPQPLQPPEPSVMRSAASSHENIHASHSYRRYFLALALVKDQPQVKVRTADDVFDFKDIGNDPPPPPPSSAPST